MNVLISVRQPVVAWVIPPAHVERLRRRFPDIRFIHALDERADLDGIADADVAFTWTMTPEMLRRAGRLRWVHSSAVAVGTLPLPDLAARGVAVTNSRGIQSPAIAEHVIACLLALAKRLPRIIRHQDTRHWAQNEIVGDASPWLVQGRTMGIIGLGTIGEAVAIRAAAMGMRVMGVRRRPELGAARGVDEVLGPEQVGTAMASSDVLVLAAPWTGATNRLVDAVAFANMKRGSVLINVARGQLVDEDALAAAVSRGHLAGAALDVFNEEPLPAASPLWSLPNVIVTPHTSGFRADHWDAFIDLFETQIDRFRSGVPLLNPVDPQTGY
jgi:phosphoglycerate dehydrogenase-like enzyme